MLIFPIYYTTILKTFQVNFCEMGNYSNISKTLTEILITKKHLEYNFEKYIIKKEFLQTRS